MTRTKDKTERDWLLYEGYFGKRSYQDVDELEDEAIVSEQFDNFVDLNEKVQTVLSQHLDDADKYNLFILADFLCKRSASSGTLQEFWNKNDALDDLARFKRNLLEVRRILKRLPEPVERELRLAGSKQMLGTKRSELGWGAKLSAETYRNFFPGTRAANAFIEFNAIFPDFLPLIDAAAETAEKGLHVGNKSIDAWRLIQASVDLFTDVLPGAISIPTHMGPTGPFYRFLSDLFYVFEFEEDPISAFRGWRRHVDRKAKKI